MSWSLAITAATVIFDNDRYLLVKEMDKQRNIPVFNQPAGHLEAGETIFCAQHSGGRNSLHKVVVWKGELILIFVSKIHNLRTIFYRRTKFSLKIQPEIQKNHV